MDFQFSIAKSFSRMMITVECNMTFSMVLNFLSIVLAVSVELNPVVSVLLLNAESFLVITKSTFLLRWRSNQK